MKDYQVVKMNELRLHGTAWVNLRNVMLGKKSKSPLDNHSIFIKKKKEKIDWTIFFTDTEYLGYK